MFFFTVSFSFLVLEKGERITDLHERYLFFLLGMPCRKTILGVLKDTSKWSFFSVVFEKMGNFNQKRASVVKNLREGHQNFFYQCWEKPSINSLIFFQKEIVPARPCDRFSLWQAALSAFSFVFSNVVCAWRAIVFFFKLVTILTCHETFFQVDVQYLEKFIAPKRLRWCNNPWFKLLKHSPRDEFFFKFVLFRIVFLRALFVGQLDHEASVPSNELIYLFKTFFLSYIQGAH